MPRLFLTYSESEAKVAIEKRQATDETGLPIPSHNEHVCTVWISERDELKLAVEGAPKVRLNHILQEVDRGIRQLALQVEAFAAFSRGFRKYYQKPLRAGLLTALLVFLLGDLALHLLTGIPASPWLLLFLTGKITLYDLVWPATAGLIVLALTLLTIQRFLFPRYTKKIMDDLDHLIPLETAYKRDLWVRVREKVSTTIATGAGALLFRNHRLYLKRLEMFIDKELHQFYERISDG
jgi:hypothetical protein